MQIFLIVLLFLGLMSLAAGIGAFAAGERTFSYITGIAGIAVIVIDVIWILIYRRRRAD